jgi:hypothetical protein
LGANLINNCGPALDGQALHVAGDLFLQENTSATTGDRGDAEACTIGLHGAQVGGQLGFIGARLQNPHGPVLDLMDVHAGTVFLPAELLCPHCAGAASTCETVFGGSGRTASPTPRYGRSVGEPGCTC